MESWLKVCLVLFCCTPLALQAQRALSFTLCANGSHGCGVGLSTALLPVAVEFRTVGAAAGSVGQWTPLGDITIDADLNHDECNEHHFSLDPVPTDDLFQFRLIQREHAGSLCNCWTMLDVAVSNNHQSISLSEGCDASGHGPHTVVLFMISSPNFCVQPANVPRFVESHSLNLSSTPVGEVSDCPQEKATANVPLCTNTQSAYLNITFQLQVNNNGTGCDCNDRLDEGVELAFRTTTGGDWIPVMYYLAPAIDTTMGDFGGDFNNSSDFITIRGYQFPVRFVTTSDPIVDSVLLCGVNSSSLQLRWLQSVQQEPNASRDSWALDNVIVSYVDFTMKERLVLEDNFNMMHNDLWLPARFGQIVNATEGCLEASNGQALVFGIHRLNLPERNSRFVITTPLDLIPEVVCVDGDSRLIAGATSADGLLETCFNNVYQPVNARVFTELEASTVCRQLEINTGGTVASGAQLTCSHTLLDVSCVGGERSLAECNISTSDAELGSCSQAHVCCVADLDIQLEILLNNVTLENYQAVVGELSSIANQSVVAVEEQTEANLGRIATVFNSVASLVANTSALTIIVENTIVGLVETLNAILQWDSETLAANGLDIIENFELIAAAFADRSVGIVITTPDIAFVAENQDTGLLQKNGRSFFSSDNNGVPDPNTGDGMTPNTLAPTQTAFINLPATVFDRVPEDRPNVGVFFALYDNPSLFPVAEAEIENNTRVVTVLSPVIAATVGPGLFFMDLEPPVSILLRLQELGENETMSFGSERCVSWDFEANGGEGNWTTDGCETISLVDGVVTCQCNHLTNFAILVDICLRINGSDCTPPPALAKALQVLTIVGVSLSLFGLVITIITLTVIKTFRDRDASKYHVQLCLAMICMLLVFVTGINRTAVYGGCVLVSVLIHYFTLVAVLWMAAEALLMFQKFVIVFVTISTKFIVTVSILCWTIPIIPVAIPLIVDLTTRPEQDIVVNRDKFCFLNHPGAFFGAFLGPIFALLIFNVIIFIWVIVVLVRHTKDNAERQKQGMKNEAAIAMRLVISISGIMFLFGLTWLFGALTITVTAVNLLFQILFVVLNSLQGFFIFLFLCVFNKEATDAWKEILSFGHYKSKALHPAQGKYVSSGNQTHKNKKKSSNGMDTAPLAAINKSYIGSSLSHDTLDRIKDLDHDMALVSIAVVPSDDTKQVITTAEDVHPPTAETIKGSI